MNASVEGAPLVEGAPVAGAPAPAVRPAARPLSWSRTVAREMVHRDSVAEVLLTEVRRAAGGGFEAAASWPRSHPTFPRGGTGLHSPLMIVETLRQLGIYVPLRYFGVAPSARLIITDLHFETDPAAEPRARSGASRVSCRVRVGGLRHGPDGEVTGLRLDVSYRADGLLFARSGGGARFLTPEQYDAVRADAVRAPSAARTDTVLRADMLRAPAAVPPDAAVRPDARLIGVAGPHDTMIAAVGTTLLVEPADLSHPYFFDHPTDHLPGMIVLEAARQAAAVESGGRLLRPTAGRLKTARFIEYAPPARVLCVPHHATCVFRFLQGGEQKAFGVLRYQ
ncbi:ScbA/BarX family gamma-butyrolactone biosynthesis protein [Streptomyces paludis]|uniref:A-factor biosynthesis protein n=1 Tax=Streptomyces paludis TaxID=2282738 RepID=A0A345HW15_9ACTN|nr:ScbA/BarX family gamma-butyrolactone biosynthesis protein [Streptomyces paludis]AXG80889.1 A-factor biosynthesis protein [Streptomyces paludis]